MRTFLKWTFYKTNPFPREWPTCFSVPPLHWPRLPIPSRKSYSGKKSAISISGSHFPIRNLETQHGAVLSACRRLSAVPDRVRSLYLHTNGVSIIIGHFIYIQKIFKDIFRGSLIKYIYLFYLYICIHLFIYFHIIYLFPYKEQRLFLHTPCNFVAFNSVSLLAQIQIISWTSDTIKPHRTKQHTNELTISDDTTSVAQFSLTGRGTESLKRSDRGEGESPKEYLKIRE